MSLEVAEYSRKSFIVSAVQVTSENMEEAAKWCDGDIRDNTDRVASPNEPRQDKFIKVRVHNPLNDRQTMAFVGDWILYAGKGYKVYVDKAFKKSFDTVVEPQEPIGIPPTPIVPVKQADNVFDNTATQADGSSTSSNPGGTRNV